jgi:CRP/FNR family transcriptional regulator, cyclic AMP receptor protein
MTWNTVLTSALDHLGLAHILWLFLGTVHFVPGPRRNSGTTSSSPKELAGANLPLPSRELFAFAASLASRECFRKGQIIFIEGAVANEVFVLMQGLVKLTVTREDGKELVLDVIGSGDFFGEEALICRAMARHYNVVCISDAEITKIDSKQISRALRENSEMTHMFLVYALKRTKAIQEHLANCLLNSGAERLVRTLLANEGRLGEPEKLSQQTLGEMIGMTRQYVNFLLRDLRRSNARKQNNGAPSLLESTEQHSSTRHSRPLRRRDG